MQKRDLIYRDDLIAAYDAAHKGPPGGARKLVEEAPAVDAAPVVHGRWIDLTNDNCDDLFKCSECKETWLGIGGYNYCPNCGAKMDGGKDDVEQ